MGDKQAEAQQDATHSALDVQIIDIDSYMAAPIVLDCKLREPYNIFDEPLKQVPVLRIFGATKSRQRICLHVHQVWPYMYIRYDGPHDPSAMRKFGYQLGLSLNHALNIALNSSGMLFVAAVVPVKGVPFYGYHVGYRPFLKIFLSNPKVVSRAGSLLASGAVMGRKMDIFESHLPYTLQFLVDYNLYGMGWINLSKVLFRSPLPGGSSNNTDAPRLISDCTVGPEHRWVPQGMPTYLCNPHPPERICRSELEADVIGQDIINRQLIPERQVHHKLDESEFKGQPARLVHSLRTIWADENERRISRGMPSLHSLSSQVQQRVTQGEPSGGIVPCIIHDKPEILGAATSLQWPNHWRAQSMLQSMLANDRVSEHKKQTDFDMWLCSWPTCREVDTGDVSLLSAGAASPTRFYIGDKESIALPQVSGGLVPQPLLQRDNRHSEGSAAVVMYESVSSQYTGPVVVDAGLITKGKDGECDGGMGVCGKDNNDNCDYSSDPFATDSDGGSIEEGGVSDLDEAWMVEELLRVEKHISSDGEIAGTGIPQVDGAGDSPGDEPTKGKCKMSKYQRRVKPANRSKARKLRPLTLYSSKESTTESSSDDGSGSNKRRAAGRLAVKSNSADGLFEQADKADQDVLLARKRNACVSSRTRRGRSYLDESVFASRKLVPNKYGSTSRQRVSGVYVDIPHPEGSAICAYQSGISNKMGLALSAEMLPTVSNTRSTIRFSASDSCRLLDDGGKTSNEHHHPGEQRDSSSQSLYLRQRLLRCKYFFVYKPMPPSVRQLQASYAKYGIVEHVAQEPYFSDAQDMPKIVKTYLGSAVRVSSNSADQLPIFDPTCARGDTAKNSGAFCRSVDLRTGGVSTQVTERRYMMWSRATIRQANADAMGTGRVSSGLCSRIDSYSGWWMFSPRAPVYTKNRFGSTSIASFSSGKTAQQNNTVPTQTPVSIRQRDQSDIKWNSVLGNLLPSQTGRRIASNAVDVSGSPTKTSTSVVAKGKIQGVSKPTGPNGGAVLSQLSLELLARCHEEEAAQDPQRDMITCIAACFFDAWHRHPASDDRNSLGYRTILWTCNPTIKLARLGLPSYVEHIHHEDELDMIKGVAKYICRLDPDILCGYEVENSSWGYLVERSQTVYGIDLGSTLSRISKTSYTQRQEQPRAEEKGGPWSNRKHIGISVAGRHTLNLWKIMRSELSLKSYSFENVVQKVLGEKWPRYSPTTLSTWLIEGPAVARIRALRHLYHRASAVLRILDKANIVDRTAEFANVLGIDFTSVLTRGSQFRVESLMARIAHPELFILSSPTRDQVAQQRAAECLPLVLEPKSRYYTDPVVVLDFQSLYPSIMIAYNYCFSTCLGSLDNASSFGHAGAGDGSTERRFGFTSIAVPPGLLSTLGHQNITVSPNGILFVKQSVRKGLLGRMLEEILESRVMIKESIDLWSKDDEALHKKLDAWQLGLKLIANVTYGYTGASFSGRMPCVEVADAIVQTGRETLENAIRFIQSRHNMWGAEVVYGDTDSMFIHFPGKTRQTAFRLGHEIADAITKLNPRPVRLKFEKVYQPCVLLTKKRYAGWMYTSVDQTEPQLDVKGMELVRRDGCGIQQSILEGAMDMLFRENDLSLVKSFVTAQINKVLRHDVPVDEFIIAKEVRLGTYSGRTLPAHAKVARDMLHSKQGDPLHGERVSYIVISNGARTRLNDQVIPPLLLLKRPGLRLDHQYYIEKQIIPALDRVFGLVGVDVRAWINDMPRHLRNSIYDAFSDTSGSDTEDDTAVSGVSDRNQSFSSCKSLGRPAYGNIEYATAAKRSSTRTLDKFYHKRSCMLCQQVIAAMPPSPGRSTTAARPPPGIRICERCWLDSAATAAQVGAIYRDVGSAYNAAIYTCINCVGGHRTSALQAVEACECVDCPVLFQRKSLKRRYQSWSKAASALDSW